MGLGPGYLVSKHVKLVRMLGRGGMGSVWIADHLALKTQVAVKFMSAAFASDPAMVTRFEREATSAAQIKSPHVVHIHDHGVTSESVPFIVMELLEGEDLSTRLKRTGPLALEDVAAVVEQVCKALGKAHKLGIVHRDIKPSNIFLLETDGEIFIKVLDFGIAKPGGTEASEVTNTGAIVGTVVYMSPEQLLNAKNVDYRADLWSVGVVAYRAMTGHLPFTDEDGIGSLCLAFEQASFTPASHLDEAIPPEVDAWFEKAFKRDPGARFASARDMAKELFTALGRTSAPSLMTSPSSRRTAVSRGGRQKIFAPASRRHSVTGPTEDEGKPTVADTHPSRHDLKEPSPDGPISSTLESRTPRSGPGAELSRVSVSRDQGTLGEAAALTFPGTTATTQPGRSGRRALMIGGALLAVAIGGAAAITLIKSAQPGSIVSDPGAQPSSVAAPSVAPASSGGDAIAPALPTAPIGSAAASAAPSAPVEASAPSASAASAAPSAQASAAPASSIPPAQSGAARPTAGPKGPTRPGTPSRPTPEKDYGF